MKDCKDLLTVYQGTHWADGYTTVEQVKAVHKLLGFKKWGWLVASQKGTVIGEIIFRVESNPVAGKSGVIEDIGVDVRYQKRHGHGRKLVRAAEAVLKQKKVTRIFVTSPPEAYNFWMKVKYFARGSLVRIEKPPKEIPVKRTKKISTVILSDVTKLPKTMTFSHYTNPGALIRILRLILNKSQPGRLLEFYRDDVLVGVGATVRNEDGSAEFVADATKKGIDYIDVIISRTAKAASKIGAKSAFSIIPSDHEAAYMDLTNWSTKRSRDIPVTKLL